MICRPEDTSLTLKPNMFGGAGTTQLRELFQKGQYKGHCRLIGTLTLEPGASVGTHVHQNDEELIFVLSGECEYCDNGTATTLQPGNAALTRSGESHAIVNRGLENCVYLAIVLTY